MNKVFACGRDGREIEVLVDADSEVSRYTGEDGWLKVEQFIYDQVVKALYESEDDIDHEAFDDCANDLGSVSHVTRAWVGESILAIEVTLCDGEYLAWDDYCALGSAALDMDMEGWGIVLVLNLDGVIHLLECRALSSKFDHDLFCKVVEMDLEQLKEFCKGLTLEQTEAMKLIYRSWISCPEDIFQWLESKVCGFS